MAGCSLVMGDVPGKDRAGLTDPDAGDSGVYDSGKWDTSIEDARADVERDADAADAADTAVKDAPADSDASPCDGAAERVFFLDRDGDGRGLWTTATVACEPPSPGTWVTLGDDCHDNNAAVHPGQTSHFPDHYLTEDGAYSFDYDCNGREVGAPTQYQAPRACAGLLCGTKGYLEAPERPRYPAVIKNDFCGSNLVRECSLVGCMFQDYTVPQRYACN
jgi:hypothetical protein